MTQIIEHIEAHYETNEVPFGRSYAWHPEHILFECDCGEQLTLFASSTTITCRCGADHGALIHDIRKREARLPDKTIHPGFTTPKSRRNSTCEMRPLIPRTRLGATTTLRRESYTVNIGKSVADRVRSVRHNALCLVHTLAPRMSPGTDIM